MSLTRLTSKGQITIPKAIREALSLSQGDKVEFILTQNNEVILKPLTKDIDEVFGQLALYQKDKPVSIDEMNQAIKHKLKDNFS